MPKITSECCELVKLSHINRSGPVFLKQRRTALITFPLIIVHIHMLSIGDDGV